MAGRSRGLQGAIDPAEDVVEPLTQCLPRCCEFDATGRAGEQCDAENGLKPTDLLAEGGLRDAGDVGSAAKMQLLGQNLEITQVTQLERGTDGGASCHWSDGLSDAGTMTHRPAAPILPTFASSATSSALSFNILPRLVLALQPETQPTGLRPRPSGYCNRFGQSRPLPAGSAYAAKSVESVTSFQVANSLCSKASFSPTSL